MAADSISNQSLASPFPNTTNQVSNGEELSASRRLKNARNDQQQATQEKKIAQLEEQKAKERVDRARAEEVKARENVRKALAEQQQVAAKSIDVVV